jgi:hypothetical protein
MSTLVNKMKIIGLISSIALAAGLLVSTTQLGAHGSDSSNSSERMIVTRHFTGIWDQVDQEAQGLAIQVVEQLDDARKSVVYWYTYGADRKTAWFIGIGFLVDNRMEFELFESTDVGFMQDAVPGADSVNSIGTMIIVFDSCDSGAVSYETDHAEVGDGTFNIERILEVMNTHCSGGISDDMHADGMFGSQRLELIPARDGITGRGYAAYEDYPGHMEFEVDVEGLQDGEYHLYVGMQNQGGFLVHGGRGDMEFSSPAEDGHHLMNFDPRGERIEVHDSMGAVLSSFDDMLEEDDHGHHGDGDGHHGDDDHNYDCEFGPGSGHNPGHNPGHGMGMGMADCVEDGEFIEIEMDLVNTGLLPEANGEAEWEMNSQRVEFSVQIADVPVGSYPLLVGGTEVGIIEAFEMHHGDVYGHIRFRDPASHGREHLDFEPRDQKIEVLQDGKIILKVDFPAE